MNPRAAWSVALLVPILILCGDLGAPYPHGQVAFEAVQHDHFDALAVAAERGAPSKAPLVVRVHRVGDAADADLSASFAWLREHANVQVVDDPRGAPLFLTRGDLAATSGRSTLGATLQEGMAVEVGKPDVGACVMAHEMLHFLGLSHVEDARNIMYRHCTPGMLAQAHLDPWQRAQLDGLASLRATTPRGVVTWASR
jgi:hypothetical protein